MNEGAKGLENGKMVIGGGELVIFQGVEMYHIVTSVISIFISHA